MNLESLRVPLRRSAVCTALLLAACEGKPGVLTDFTTADTVGTNGMSSAPGPGDEASTSPPALTEAASTSGSEPLDTTTTGPTTTGVGGDPEMSGTSFDPSATEGDPAPPFDTFNPNFDIGDGTLDKEELLLITETPKGRMHLWWTPERLGDGWQGFIGPAAFVDGSWHPVGESVWHGSKNAPVIDNYIPLGELTLELPLATHPFEQGPAVVTLFLDTWLYADKLLCGQIDVTVVDQDKYVDLPFVTKRIAEFATDPTPPLTCE